MNAVVTFPAVYVNAGRNFGLSRRVWFIKVLYPAVIPQLIIGLRITLGIAWLVVVAAEMIAVNSGLGFLIVDARNAGNRYDLVVAGMVHDRSDRAAAGYWDAFAGAGQVASLGLFGGLKCHRRVSYSDRGASLKPNCAREHLR